MLGDLSLLPLMLVYKIKLDGVMPLSKYRLLSCNNNQVPIILSP